MGGKASPVDFQELQSQQALEKLHFVARKRFRLQARAEAFKKMILGREVFLSVKGLTKKENLTLFKEWKRRRRLKQEKP